MRRRARSDVARITHEKKENKGAGGE